MCYHSYLLRKDIGLPDAINYSSNWSFKKDHSSQTKSSITTPAARSTMASNNPANNEDSADDGDDENEDDCLIIDHNLDEINPDNAAPCD